MILYTLKVRSLGHKLGICCTTNDYHHHSQRWPGSRYGRDAESCIISAARAPSRRAPPFSVAAPGRAICNWRKEFCPVVQIQLMKTVGRETALKIWALTSGHGEVHRIPFEVLLHRSSRYVTCCAWKQTLVAKALDKESRTVQSKICIYGK